MKEPFFVGFVLFVGITVGLSAWPIAERFKAVPAYCVVDQPLYDSMVSGNPR